MLVVLKVFMAVLLTFLIDPRFPLDHIIEGLIELQLKK